MVCLGNICRSPLAEGILKEKLSRSDSVHEVDSAGTAAYHVGEPPDGRSQKIAKKYGIDISGQRARRFTRADFDQFDRIYAMDRSNLEDILALARDSRDISKVDLILNAACPGEDRQVPDPYYGGSDGFEKVFQLLKTSCEVIANDIAGLQQAHNKKA